MNRKSVSIVAALALLTCWTAEVRGQAHFLRGDIDQNARVQLTDAIGILSALFLGTGELPCRDAADVDDSGKINIGDPINLLSFQFLGGDPPAAPYPRIEADPTADDPVTGELGCLGPCEELIGPITSDRTLTSNKCYLMKSGVFVREPAVLTIEAGTTILGEKSSKALLVIDRGAKLMAVGTADAPIIFTSDQPPGLRRRGDWGGLIILGRGDLNVDGKEAFAEGLTGEKYGGGATVIPDDNSGRLSYLRIEFGGILISENNEVNGLSLFSVGSGTQIDHIQVRYNLDDGIEWFGGAVSVKYALATGISDDNFDWSFAWNGNGQFWVAQQRGDEADCGFEVDNNEPVFTARPLTNPAISNVTLIGDPDTNEGPLSTQGIVLRRGCGSRIYNTIVQGFKVVGFDIDDKETTAQNPVDNTLVLDYCIFFENGTNPERNRHFRTGETGTAEETEVNGFAYTTVRFATELNTHNIIATQSPVVDPYNLNAPNFKPQNDALTPGFDPTSISSYFEPAPFRGGVDPTKPDWTQERWISYTQN